MMIFKATGVKLVCTKRETVTTGLVNAIDASFTFDSAWGDLSKVAVFKSGAGERTVLLENSDTCKIPHEVLINTAANTPLYVGVYGTKITDGATVMIIPTIWCVAAYNIELGTDNSADETAKATPTIYEQIMADNLATRNQTNKDAMEVAADREQADKDALATASDRQSINAMVTGFDTHVSDVDKLIDPKVARAEKAAVNAETNAELAQQAAVNAGYLQFEINDGGHLIETRTDTVPSDIVFSLSEGRLEIIYG